jgi:bifunctional non-homologous end joining protein LigD
MRAPAPAGDTAVLGVAISKPDKALWPAVAGHGPMTKIDLARYLANVGDFVLAHIRGCPCSIIRAPDGITGASFFQRHAAPSMNKLVTLTRVPGDRKSYIEIDSIEALIALAQIAALEFHPWNCQPKRPDVPGRLVFDLDPGPDLPFDAVVAAAKELKKRLERLGLFAFCKTTGGKGLHVVTPLALAERDGIGWKEAKTFAQALCTAMASDSPDRYLITMTKRLRAGRIYLDYLRNDCLATAVAVLSPRARSGAPVSMPHTWHQVRVGLDPQRFTLATAPTLLAKSPVWQNYAAAERPLRAAIEKLAHARR